MTIDLFANDEVPSRAEFDAAFQNWRRTAVATGTLQREASADVYEHMWVSLTTWALANGTSLPDITAGDLEAYLASRGGPDELTARYAWRLLRLVDRVLRHHAAQLDHAPNEAATEVMAARPDIRYANASHADPLPEYLPASEAKRLVTYLSAVRPSRGARSRDWQEVRNRSAVGLMLGGGLTPGEVRRLKLEDVVTEGSRVRGLPWKLRVLGDGNSPDRETPIASWAGQLLRFWLEVRAQQGIPGTMVFPSTKSAGKQWGKVAQYNAGKSVLKAAGLDDAEGGSFKLRHTFALRQLRKGTAPEEVARWLGVEDPGVMARYRRVLSVPVDVA